MVVGGQARGRILLVRRGAGGVGVGAPKMSAGSWRKKNDEKDRHSEETSYGKLVHGKDSCVDALVKGAFSLLVGW